MTTQNDNPIAFGAVTPRSAEEDRVAKKFFDKEPLKVEPGEFFSMEGMLKTTLDQNLTRLGDTLGMSIEEQTVERGEFSDIARRAGLFPGVARAIHDAWTSTRLAAPVDEAEEDEQLRQANTETRRALREQWGAKDAEDLLQRAQKFVKQHPKLATILSTGNIGSRKVIVQALVEHVRRVNFR